MIKRIIYGIYFYFASRLPVSYHPFGIIGKHLRFICAKVLFRKCGRNVNIEHGADFGMGNSIEIGDYSGIGIHAKIESAIIGKYVMMGPDVIILSQNHCYALTHIPMCFQGTSEISPVIIEDDVWIGARAIILPGKTIGRGSIVAAGAVVTQDVSPWSIMGGNPARMIRKRL